MSKPILETTEYFGRTWVWFTILALFIVVLFAFMQLLAMGVNRVIMAMLVPGLTVFFFLVVFFKRFAIYIRIDKKALEFQFQPTQKEIQVVEWKHVSDIDIVDLSTVMQLAGWGIRHDEKRVYNLNGRQALQLTFPNGRKLLLGSKRADELYRAAREAKRRSKRTGGEE